MPDFGASILTKLKNKSISNGTPYQLCLQLFMQEEFLRRLAKSEHASNLILKGGLFIYNLTNFESRATVDIDFLLRRMNSDLESINKMINDVISTPTGYNDVVALTLEKIEQISPQRKYPGVSVQIIGKIKNVRVPFDVDLGVGDLIVPKAQKRAMQVQLDGYEPPEILTYSLESTISEKLDAILQRFELTGRMKDFYDIYYLSHSFDIKGATLLEAIQKTLSSRETSYSDDGFNRLVLLAEDLDMQIKWRYFLRTIKSGDILLEEVIAGIDIFLHPVWDAMVVGDKFSKTWNAKTTEWR
jgi:predicted nucleotidyltransferase component of viral defense system